MPGQGAAQSDPPPGAAASYNPVSGAAHAIGAPFRALWKVRGHVPTGTAPGEPESTDVIGFEQGQGTSTSLGAFFMLDTDAGYAFTPDIGPKIGARFVFDPT